MKCPVCDNSNLKPYLHKKDLEYFECLDCRIFLQSDFENLENSESYGKEDISNHSDIRFIGRYIGTEKIIYRYKRAQFNCGFLLDYIESSGFLETRSSGLNILDIGAGTGENLYILKNTAALAGSNCILMERSPIDRSIAKTLYGMDAVNDFSQLDQDKFDIITIHHVLEHIAEPQVFVRNIVSHLNPGGLIFLTMPDPYRWYPRLIKGRWQWFNSDHLVMYSVQGCRKLFEQNGLHLVSEKRSFLEHKSSLYRDVRFILSTVVRKHCVPGVLQDGYAQIYQMQ